MNDVTLVLWLFTLESCERESSNHLSSFIISITEVARVGEKSNHGQQKQLSSNGVAGIALPHAFL